LAYLQAKAETMICYRFPPSTELGNWTAYGSLLAGSRAVRPSPYGSVSNNGEWLKNTQKIGEQRQPAPEAHIFGREY